MGAYLLGCDWGTSSFRLRLLDIDNHQIVSEILSDKGVAVTFSDWKVADGKNLQNRYLYFRDILKKNIELLSAQVNFNLNNIPLMLSGMASSSIGMEEVPYGNLPFVVNGSKPTYQIYEADNDFTHRIILISGLKSDNDVMRGEETELIGLLDLLGQSDTSTNSILIFPGTHSKHMYVEDGQLVDFKTFMTGEIFHVMANFSILKDSISKGNLSDLSELDLAAFQLGVVESSSANMLHSLFSVRTNQLFNKLSKAENSYYLSGLLIGNEVLGLSTEKNHQLILCSGSNLFELYQLAFEQLQIKCRTISADLIDRAAMEGQLKIFKNLKDLIV